MKITNFFHRVWKTFFLLILSISFLSFLSYAEDITVNRLLAAQCAQCHGPNGKAVDKMEKLTDESAKDLFEDLRDMRREDRPENIMDHQALGYTQDQIRRIANYYGFLSGKNDEDPEDGDRETDRDTNSDSDRDSDRDEDRDSDEEEDDEDEDEDEDEDDEDDEHKDKKRRRNI